MSSINYTSNKMGTVEHNGVRVELADMAEQTSRLLPGEYTNYNDVEDGEEYHAEWSAPGKNEAGEDVTVYWIHKDIKGENARLAEEFDWNNVSRIEID